MTTISDKFIHFWSRSKLLIIIFITLALLMIVSALIELSQSKKELYDLMEDQAESLIESIIISSKNSLLTNESISRTIKDRLLNNAVLISHLFEIEKVTNSKLKEICDQNNLYRINIFNNHGEKLFYSHEQEHAENEKYDPKQILEPIFSGMVDTLIIGIVPARHEDSSRYSVAIAGMNRSAIVVNIDAQKVINFRKTIGFGPLLRNIEKDNKSIIYTALQDTTSILAASGNINSLESINGSEFLSNSLIKLDVSTRITEFDTTEVFEVVNPFIYNNQQIGLLRIGLSMLPIQDINQRIIRRLMIITVILFIIGGVIFSLIFTLQRFGILRKQYSIVETYSSNIIKNASDAIIVFNESDGIMIFNKSAENIFSIKEAKILSTGIDVLFSKIDLAEINKNNLPIIPITYNVNNIEKYLLIAKTSYYDEKDVTSTILMIRDLTEQRLMEEQIERSQRLTAMGELASGVAHEIRNPLNTISTIVQQLDKDFAPKSDVEEYHELSNIVYKEVNRIDKTVKEFLQFAKPEEIKPESFKLSALLEEVTKQYKNLTSKKHIELKVEQNWDGIVNWDFNKIKQVFINLLDNAIDAINKDGSIIISVNEQDNVIINIKDSGEGILESAQNKIFNLYYTTKAKGTGIGLSIVQRIIFEHSGTISVKSERNIGTSVNISIPISIKNT